MNSITFIFRATDEAESIAAGPGTIGWVFTFAMALGAGFLIYDMVRRVRKVRYREEIRQEISEEQAAADEAAELARQRKSKS
jgi:uncharacterized protein HemX